MAAGKMAGKSGTTVILSGLRRNASDESRLLLELSCPFRKPEGKPHGFPTDHDLFLCSPATNSTDKYDEFAGRDDNVIAPMDFSFRAFCQLMFLKESRKPPPTICLFGRDVEMTDIVAELEDRRTTQIAYQYTDSKGQPVNITVEVHTGCHPPSKQQGLSGAVLYCENTLIESFARSTLYIKDETSVKFGVLMVVNLAKKDFTPTENKVAFEWGGRMYFNRLLKKEYENYVEYAVQLDNDRNPIRVQLRTAISDMKEKLERKFGPRSQGNLVGLLYTPQRQGEQGDEYAYKIENPISMVDLEAGVEAGWKFKRFKERIKQMFLNICQNHSRERWVPDNDMDDIRNVSLDDIADRTIPKLTGEVDGVHTISLMLKEAGIPEDFNYITLWNNQKRIHGLRS